MTRILSAVAILTIRATAAPPNAVMIIGDDQGWRDYGFMGHPHIKTPNLDKLAATHPDQVARFREKLDQWWKPE